MWFIRKINKRIYIINILIFNSIFNNLNASEFFMEDDSNVGQHSSNRISLCSLESLGNYLTSFKNILSTCSCLYVKKMNLYQLVDSEEEEKHTLIKLPSEILLKIANKLNGMDVLKLSLTCRRFCSLLDHNYWERRNKKSKFTPWNQNYINPVKLHFSYLWFIEGKKNNHYDLIKKSARIGLPQAIKYLEYLNSLNRNGSYCEFDVTYHLININRSYLPSKMIDNIDDNLYLFLYRR